MTTREPFYIEHSPDEPALWIVKNQEGYQIRQYETKEAAQRALRLLLDDYRGRS